MPDSNDRPEFAEVLESCRRFLLAIANDEIPADLRAKGGASDLVQQTFAAALRWKNQFRGQSLAELRAWLRAILRSEAAVFRRQFYGTASRDISREVTLETGHLGEQQTPPLSAIHSEENERLWRALDTLSESHKLAVMLRMENQMTFTQIGVKLNRSEEAARKLFNSAVCQLRLCLSNNSDTRDRSI